MGEFRLRLTLIILRSPAALAVGIVILIATAGPGPLWWQPVSADSASARDSGDLPLLIGYWHNFVNRAGFIQLGKVSAQFDVIDVAFGTPLAGSTSTIDFKVDASETQSQFIADVAGLHRIGKKVVLSIGGANGLVQLKTNDDLRDFVRSVSSVIKKFGFDGVDIDFEAASLALDPGDRDFKNPTTPTIVNLISALRQLKKMFGRGFIISMAPGTYEVHAGLRSYGPGAVGVYLPVIFATRDILSFVHVQDYNSGTRFGLDGKIYSEGTADFHVAMTEMLLQGFPVAGNVNNVFPALRPAQVAFGVPAYKTERGFTSNSDLRRALSYLTKGISFGGQYTLRQPAGYPGLCGLMLWSINWDAAYGYSLSNEIGPFLHQFRATRRRV